MDLTDAQIERYSRQIILPAVGGRGQQRLLDSTVGVVGAGPLAVFTAWYLTAAGIGALQLWTGTEVASNLLALRQDLAAFNPDTTVAISPAKRGRSRGGPQRRGTGALQGADQADGVLVCADVTAAVLEQVNGIALRQRIPLLAGSAGTEPRITLYAGHDREHPCAACDPRPPIGDVEATASNPAIGLIGSLLALEAIKASLALPGLRPGTGLHYEPETLTISECPIAKRAACRACAPAGGIET
jgi:molybdopterin/thiamine biosynthesis adenylyltransferase